MVLKKRALALGIMMVTLENILLEVAAILGAALLFSLVIVAGVAIAAGIASQHNMQQDWYVVAGAVGERAEKWAPGQPLPPCGTPI